MAIVRARVDIREFKKHNDWDRDRAFKILFQEFKHRCSDAGIMPMIKEHQHYESKGVKLRRKKRDSLNKRKEDEIAEKLRRGEKVIGNIKLVKKILNKTKKKKQDKDRELYSY